MLPGTSTPARIGPGHCPAHARSDCRCPRIAYFEPRRARRRCRRIGGTNPVSAAYRDLDSGAPGPSGAATATAETHRDLARESHETSG